MKFWLNSDGKSVGGRRFYVRVEEMMVDKDGKPVYVPTPAPAVEEPAPVVEPEVVAAVEPATEEPVAEAVETAEPVETVTTVVTDNSDVVAAINELSESLGLKYDAIIELLKEMSVAPVVAPVATTEEPAEEVEEIVEVVEEVAEEPAEEAVEEPAEEVAATEYVDLGDEDPDTLIAILAGAEETPAEEPAVEAVASASEEEKAPAVRSRCFAEKMRDASEILQDRYDELKNYALRFRKLKSRISRKFDSINQGRFQFVKLGVAGKTLKLYLNMDINTTDPKFHCKDMSDKKTYVTVPTMLRIKSGRAVKYAKILIDQCAEQHGMLERRKPFVVDAMALIEESLQGKEAPDVETDDVDTTGDAE